MPPEGFPEYSTLRIHINQQQERMVLMGFDLQSAREIFHVITERAALVRDPSSTFGYICKEGAPVDSVAAAGKPRARWWM